MEGKSAVFLRLSSRPIPRVARMMKVAQEVGYEVLFIGANREKGLPESGSWEGYAVRRVGREFPLLNGKSFVTYLSGCLSYWFSAIKTLFQLRPDVVHASDLEAFFPALVYSRIARKRLIYNIHDNIAQRYSVSVLVKRVLNGIEGLAVLLSSTTLVPEAFRRDALPSWCHARVRVARNSPIDPGYSAPNIPIKGSPVRIFFGGWLDYGRGLRELVQLVGKKPGIELIVAGEGAPEVVEWLAGCRNVTYRGFLPHRDIMEETRAAHFVAAFYDPKREINRYAASNKIAEALAVGRPVLVNVEMRICSYLEEAGCCISVPYLDEDMLIARIDELVANPAKYSEFCSRARSAYEHDYDWTSVRESILNAYDDEE